MFEHSTQLTIWYEMVWFRSSLSPSGKRVEWKSKQIRFYKYANIESAFRLLTEITSILVSYLRLFFRHLLLIYYHTYPIYYRLFLYSDKYKNRWDQTQIWFIRISLQLRRIKIKQKNGCDDKTHSEQHPINIAQLKLTSKKSANLTLTM